MPDSMSGEGEGNQAINERLLLLLLSAIQFTVIVDFLIILPLGPQYMRVFAIGPDKFGVIVSAYALSAGLAGIASGLFLDHFDRKHALAVLYLGFTLGTLGCALAPTYDLLVLARAGAGAFGGVVGALILAIIGDVVPEGRRGAAMGIVMSSFSVASICGVPIGLLLASHLNWHVPFSALAVLSFLILIVAWFALPSMHGHLERAREDHPLARTLAVLSRNDHQMAFVFMAILTFTGFFIFPNIANYMVMNVGLTEKQLPLIYLFGGLCTVFSLNWIGRWADRAGKHHAFTRISFCAVIPILAVTTLPRVPLFVAIAVSTLLMVCMSGRMVPAMALLTSSIEARYRGGFMSLNSSVQQFASGLAAFASGQILHQTPNGRLLHFPVVGGISIACALACIYLARFLKSPQAAMSAQIAEQPGSVL